MFRNSADYHGEREQQKPHEPSIHDHDQWNLTPSVLDSNSFSFSQFANHDPVEFTATGTAMGPMFHNRAGDLHTPGFGIQLGTPLTTSDSNLSMIDPHGLHGSLLHQHAFHSAQELHLQQSYAPHAFVHRDSGYETMGPSKSLSAGRGSDAAQDALVSSHFSHHDASVNEMNCHEVSSGEKLRYRVTLNAATAMVKQSTEIPVTYLNKGQAYALSIHDTLGSGPAPGPCKYRTIVRVSFEDEEQRQRPSACWQLWKEGRGTAEAHQRAGKLQAVEFVDQHQGADGDQKRPRIDLDMASFDSFAVTWSPAAGSATADCTVAVRFNFLSTDFSHSKGVKGIPVRLCAKTELISSNTPESTPGSTAEVSYCKVKLFRDHGAERKLSNDVAHIKKTIDKLKQQITQVENGLKDVGKRKRQDSTVAKPCSHRAGKAPKHRRTWSVSSNGSSERPTIEDDLHIKLATFQDMFSSTRPVSVLHLKGDNEDDPDDYPVSLPGHPLDLASIPMIERRPSYETGSLSGQSTPTPCKAISPVSATQPNITTETSQQGLSAYQGSLVMEQLHPHSDWDHLTHVSNPNFTYDAPTKVTRHDDTHSLPAWIEASGVDHSYQAPPERASKPIACCYIRGSLPNSKAQPDYYQAVYLMERTARHLIKGVATKCDVDPASIARALRIDPRGLKIIIDDEVVRELPEGQDMIVELIELDGVSKQEPGSGQATPLSRPNPYFQNANLELRLMF
ncbi:uncharacterized protein KY384_005864 [Bacidia gigantensis]|uniref:uncharacterized protein n=1 Tax=Bacidia gigantensis TaxID=2732470 RepID=UPI001D04D9CD|nr:uncharacterized protein KY384_005864 [Bacidia gigantensis]KAG8529229.1 hypothetical protein KY384_005864 [Bacidia gigantensis]